MDRSYFEKYCKTIKQIACRYAAFTEPTIRWWIVKSNSEVPTKSAEAFRKCLMRIDGRLYIDQMQFEEWLRSQYVVPISERPELSGS